MGLLVPCIVLAVNIWISPYTSMVQKKPLWGNYLTDTSEHYYPYREALEWLENHFGHANILFDTMFYPYRFEFYFNQLNWTPKYEDFKTKVKQSNSVSLSQALTEAVKGNFNVVLFQLQGNEIPRLNDMYGFSQEKIFKNDAHTLIVFDKKPSGSRDIISSLISQSSLDLLKMNQGG